MKSVDGITLSPDARKLAFRVIAPSIAENRTAVQWYVVPVDGSAPATPFGNPTEPIFMPMFDMILDEVPIWSSDGHALYVRLLEDSALQIHRIGAGGADILLTQDNADIQSFRAGADGTTILYQVRNDRALIDAAVEAEEHQGVHFDRGVSAEGSRITRNLRIGLRQTTMRYASSGAAEELNLGPVRERQVRLAETVSSDADAARELKARTDTLIPKEDRDIERWLPVGETGTAVALKELPPARPFLYTRSIEIVARLKNGALRSCSDPRCRGSAATVRQVIPIGRTGEIAILSEKDYSGRTALLAWNPKSNRLRTLVAPDQALDGGASYGANRCSRLDDTLLCVRSGATEPVDLVRIDLVSGKITALAAPNADLAHLRHFPARFLEWTDRDGNAANGILLLSEPVKPGPLPLVITSYRCRGYLQGSMGKLAAEQVLAARGFAVLCVNANNAVGMAESDPPFAGYTGQLRSYEAIVDRLANEGIIDRARVGFAGHSSTSMVGALALSTGDLFHAVAIGTGITTDPATFMFTEPTTDSWRKGILQFFRMPNPVHDLAPWQAVSPALNAKRIRAPLLIQPPENEYLLALQLFGAIQQTGGTVDMYVYPNEGHTIGREPLHQVWRNRRAIDWFAFWLLGERTAFPETASQLAHWDVLKKQREERRGHENE